MGAEYYPLLLALAERHFLSIDSATVAAVRLPSSTKFNEISWEKDRLLDPVHGVDNVSHSGAEKFETNSPEQNMVPTLSKFETVVKRTSYALQRYMRVIVTADHGSSRLAVIAQEQGLNQDLTWHGEPENCRYAVAPKDMRCPSDFQPFYDAEKNISYWVVRGYNRLPKRGAMSVHGGATLEERLVPVIVFARTDVAQTVKAVAPPPTAEQLVERMDFDDL